MAAAAGGTAAVAGGARLAGGGWAGAADAAFAFRPVTAALLLLNLLDGLFTLLFLQLELARELNPLMRVAYEASPLSFMALKLGIVHFGVYVLCLHQELPVARVALRGGVVLYAAIVAYHLAFVAHLLLG
jgi:hypothetical protein